MKDIDTYKLSYYDYAVPMYGSIGGMNFRIAREPLEYVYGKKDPGEAVLEVFVWRGPYSFDVTDQEKLTKQFPYTAEGKQQSTDWLNELYESDKENWDKGLKLK